MKRRLRQPVWARAFKRNLAVLTRQAVKSGTRALGRAVKTALPKPSRARQPAAAPGTWVAVVTGSAGVAGVTGVGGLPLGPVGRRRYKLYRPPGVKAGERLPLLVMLHGCGQDANSFAASTRMNHCALRERFLVLYPEQDRLANAQGCWNWFDTASGRAQAEAALVMKAITQVCARHAVDRTRMAVAGFSAGASMAALLATQHAGYFKAVVMHSGVPPGAAHSTLTALNAMRGRRRAAPQPTTGLPWPPLLVIHGSADAVVAPANGEAAVQQWAHNAGAQATAPRRMQRGQRHPAVVTDFKHRGHTVATLVAVQGLAHAWSGGPASQPFADAQGPDASRWLWAFVARQFAA